MALAWHFKDEGVEPTLLDEVARNGAAVPSHWHWEVVNALLSAERASRLLPGQPEDVLEQLMALPIAAEPVESPLPQRVMALARQCSLSAYDASYLDLALRRHATLATRDRALGKAAKALGVSVVGLP